MSRLQVGAAMLVLGCLVMIGEAAIFTGPYAVSSGLFVGPCTVSHSLLTLTVFGGVLAIGGVVLVLTEGSARPERNDFLRDREPLTAA
jgi:hypothetical protein